MTFKLSGRYLLYNNLLAVVDVNALSRHFNLATLQVIVVLSVAVAL
jgi:hypothetical protein